MAKSTHNYTEDKIQTLSSLSHIRLRSGMYIGRLGDGNQYDDGIYVLLKEVVDNSIDEFIMHFGDKIEINISGSKVSVRDYGRGIPLGKVVECVSVINTGAKYNDDVFQFSVGLNGVGTKAVNALSSSFTVKSHRDKKSFKATFSKGVLVSKEDGTTGEKDGTLIEFIPDTEIFGSYAFDMEFIEDRICKYVYLNSGLTIALNGKDYKSDNGLKDLLSKEVEDESLYDIIHIKNDKIEYAFCHTSNMGENYFSFVNGQHTVDGGTHQAAFREGLLKAINEFSGKNFNPSDVREGIVGAISVKLKNPIFESQTKNKLGNADIKPELIAVIKESLILYLNRNKEVANKIIERVKFNETIRNEFQKVQKDARELSKKVALNIPNLRDCKYHFYDKNQYSDNTMIFITEGQSASGSMVSCRDVYTQAIFSLRGKPLNVYGHTKATVYKNEELYTLMKALGVENGMDDLRYNKVVIATDADVDGFHIRNLILTYFLVYFEQLVINGHIYILETPLFRVRDKSQTIYCYSEAEKDQATKKIKNSEITRFKGLGEISPKEFGQFIGKDIRLTKIGVGHINEIKKSLDFFMGKNTPDRKEFIMTNLI